jgi:glucose 1-dehydrogenase
MKTGALLNDCGPRNIAFMRDGAGRLRDRVAIVTGGDTGIGKAISETYAAEGAKVMIDYYGEEKDARDLAHCIARVGGSAAIFQADVSNEQDVRRLLDATIEAFGGVDVMVNNAGIEKKLPFLETPLDVWHSVIKTNLTGTWLCSQLAARQMAKQKRGGRIINISSVHEDITMPTNAPYCASKGGMKMLMRTIAVELAPLGITVNNVCPGAIDTPIQDEVKRRPEELEKLISEIPLHRMGSPEEVAALCVYLASDEAAYVTGSSYIIDGGMTKKSGSL